MLKRLLLILIVFNFYSTDGHSKVCKINVYGEIALKDPHKVRIKKVEEITKNRFGIKRGKDIPVNNSNPILESFNPGSLTTYYTSPKRCPLKRQLKILVACEKWVPGANQGKRLDDTSNYEKWYICPRGGKDAFSTKGKLNIKCKNIAKHCPNEMQKK